MKNPAKWVFTILFTSVCLGLALMALPAGAAQDPAAKAAVVNGTVITRADLERETARVVQGLRRMGRALDPSRAKELQAKVLENLIDRELLLQQAKKKGIRATDRDLSKAIGDLKKRFSGDKGFRDALSRAGIAESDLKAQLQRGLTIKKFLDKEFADRAAVSEAEARAYYKENAARFKRPEQVRASHILAKVAPGASAEEKAAARKLVGDVRKKLDKGEDFAALARKYSQGPSSKRGGDLGYFGRGRMAKPFEEAAFSLKPGQVSDVVETQFGYHLIKVTDHRPAGQMPFEEVKDKLTQFLRQKKLGEILKGYVSELKKQAKISRHLEAGAPKGAGK